MTNHKDALNAAHDERHPFSMMIRYRSALAVTPYYYERLPKNA